MKINITIECETVDELYNHLNVLKEHIHNYSKGKIDNIYVDDPPAGS